MPLHTLLGEARDLRVPLMPRNMVKESLVMNNGCVELTNAPGMGTEIDEETLNTYRDGSPKLTDKGTLNAWISTQLRRGRTG